MDKPAAIVIAGKPEAEAFKGLNAIRIIHKLCILDMVLIILSQTTT